MSTLALLLCLAAILGFLLMRGGPVIGLPLFFGDTPAMEALMGHSPVWDGIWPACLGTLTVVFLAIALALVPGIACGIWLAVMPKGRFSTLLGLGIDILAGTPSILMGLFGFNLILFLRNTFAPSANTCLLLSSLCLAMLVLPYMAVSTRAALLSVPRALSTTALSLGLSRWQALWHIQLPQAKRGIWGGVMLSLGRAAEDTAVIMLTGVVANAGIPGGLFERYEALPFTIFYFSAQYMDYAELERAFGAALVLLCLTATLFALAGALQKGARRK
ncbi:ABC transporter permease subunit [Ferrimonas sp. YFM]|uniref:PstA family ABC transporter permease n=1 Tax=Ferrimonas sp. YFM TaxID=3028878 RepID=UPI00257334B6|nr:ABC transporter permease subunit [Ferrimonas sp. YFM]